MDPRTVRAAATVEFGVGVGIFLVAWFLGVPVAKAAIVGVAFGTFTALIIIGASLMAGRKQPPLLDPNREHPDDDATEVDRG